LQSVPSLKKQVCELVLRTILAENPFSGAGIIDVFTFSKYLEITGIRLLRLNRIGGLWIRWIYAAYAVVNVRTAAGLNRREITAVVNDKFPLFRNYPISFNPSIVIHSPVWKREYHNADYICCAGIAGEKYC
jgi:hypothetical protein